MTEKIANRFSVEKKPDKLKKKCEPEILQLRTNTSKWTPNNTNVKGIYHEKQNQTTLKYSID